MSASPTILLVEDEILIADMLCGALIDEGFEVVLACDGAEALDLITVTPRIDVLVTDINIGPGTDGWDVARCARCACPAMPVIYTTGGAAHEFAQHGVAGSLLVMKPFLMTVVVTAISRLLDNPPR